MEVIHVGALDLLHFQKLAGSFENTPTYTLTGISTHTELLDSIFILKMKYPRRNEK